jgi:hypothetical protein
MGVNNSPRYIIKLIIPHNLETNAGMQLEILGPEDYSMTSFRNVYKYLHHDIV